MSKDSSEPVVLAWKRYENQRVSVNITPGLRKLLREAYYAGSADMFTRLTIDLPNESSDCVHYAIVHLHGELVRYFKGRDNEESQGVPAGGG